MNGLKHHSFVYLLYIHKDTFVGYFDRFDSAAKFAKTAYPNIDSFVRPVDVWTVEQ